MLLLLLCTEPSSGGGRSEPALRCTESSRLLPCASTAAEPSEPAASTSRGTKARRPEGPGSGTASWPWLLRDVPERRRVGRLG